MTNTTNDRRPTSDSVGLSRSGLFGHKTEQLFFEKVNKTEGCWLWTAYANPGGYGQMCTREYGNMLAHRISWMLHNGQIPNTEPRLCVLHKCDVPRCVNPDHLFLGTDADNSRDMLAKGRSNILHPVGERHGQAKLRNREVLAIIEEYEAGGVTHKELASKYRICKATISHILSGRQWSHVTGRVF